tara:strand:- start:2044 stop:2445 length:402 start_codon:yes stop_codon:yes gene_type:complete
MENKRINIQYSIDMSELPGEVDRLYSKALKEFQSIDFPKVNKKDILDHSTAKKADQIRQKIAKLDLILLDIQSIVNSYIEYEISNNNQESQDAPQMHQMNNMPDFSNISLEDMSRLLSNGNNSELQEPDQRSE